MRLRTYKADCLDIGSRRRFGVWFRSLYKAGSLWNLEDLSTQLLKFDVGDVVVLGTRKVC